MINNPWDLPEHDELPENKFYLGSMNVDKGDNDDEVTPEEMEKISKFLESINPLINPPND
jgi:hypothetical protein